MSISISISNGDYSTMRASGLTIEVRQSYLAFPVVPVLASHVFSHFIVGL